MSCNFRLAGAPNGWRYDTINFYEGELYNGLEQYYYGDAASFKYDNFGRYVPVSHPHILYYESIIVTFKFCTFC